MKTCIKNVRIFDGTGHPAYIGSILFDESGILAIGEVTESADRIIDGTGRTVLPGFIDCHVHPAGLEVTDEVTDSMKTFHGTMDMLRSGITTFRSVGTPHNADVRLRDLIESGVIDGPRILAAGKVLCITCGHCENMGICCDSADEIRKAARAQCHERVDWLKMMATSGVVGIGPATEIQLSKEQIETVIAVGRAFDTPTCAHIMNLEALNFCIDAGLTCVEHGYDMTEETAQKMIQKGTWYVPTAVVTLMESTHIQPVTKQLKELVDKAAAAQVKVRRALKIAIRAGVKMGIGTDTGCPFTNADTHAYATELYLFSISGMENSRVLETATLESAKLLGIDSFTGSLETGKCADLVVLEGDPLADIQACRNVEYTFCRGKLLYHRA